MKGRVGLKNDTAGASRASGSSGSALIDFSLVNSALDSINARQRYGS